ncbi:MAG: pseudouridine-5'-phosphate glycosidase [Firmicutes bacterium]|nr:pseudouridine-5'-phosphate glycosidase [Bacillota bacterium]
MLDLSNEVRKALATNQPLVALESTLIAHGFPYPENYNLALELESLLREQGVVPATIGVLGGRLKVGLTTEEIHYIAQAGNIRKASLRDLPLMVALGLDGGTTVATTMQVAHWAGIKVFVTGGIGGVHRHAEDTFDISADLQALANYNVLVVCAGAKSVLDLPKTLEVLESQGTPVLGYQTDNFPAFYVRDSGLKVDYRIDEISQIINAFKIKEQLGITGGMVVSTPIPVEDELDGDRFNAWLDTILTEVEEKGVHGKDVTPYILGRLHEISCGETVQANRALIKNNLNLGAQLAKAYSAGGN